MPFSVHCRVFTPIRVNPFWQEYVAFPPNDVVVTVTDPPLGLLRDPQSTAIEGEVACVHYDARQYIV